jgi:hypothetical protein
MNKFDTCYTRDLVRWGAALRALRHICQRGGLYESPLQWLAHGVDLELDALEAALGRRSLEGEVRHD